jgi:ATP-dependent protease Clp ATPase subunit
MVHKCSFCRKTEQDCVDLIIVDMVGICDECVVRCVNVLTAESRTVIWRAWDMARKSRGEL